MSTFTSDIKRATLISMMLAFIKSNTRGVTEPMLREAIYLMDPSVTDAVFSVVFDQLRSDCVIPAFNGTNPSNHLYMARPNTFVRVLPGESAASYDVHHVELSDHYPTFSQQEEMDAVLADDTNQWLGAQIIDAAFQELEPGLTRFFRRKPVVTVTEQLLIARVLHRLCNQPKIIDYFTVKAFLSHPAFTGSVKCETVAEFGMMAHHYSAKYARRRLPDLLQIESFMVLASNHCKTSIEVLSAA